MGFLNRIKRFSRYSSVSSGFALLLAFLLVVTMDQVGANENEKQIATTNAESASQTFEKALEGEQSDLADMDQMLERWKTLRDSTINEIKAYRIQNTAYENLLLASPTRIEILETALNNNRLAIKSLHERIDEFEKIGNNATVWLAQISDRISIAEKRMAELKREGWAEADRQKTQDKLRKFIAILRDKKSRGQQFQKEHTDLSGKLTETSSDLDETRRRLELRLQLQEKSKLLERNPHPFESIGIDRFTLEIKTAWGRLTGFFKADYWTQQWHNFHRSGGMTQSIFFILFLSALITRKKIREFVQSIEARLEGSVPSRRRLALMLLRRSFLLIWATILLWLYDLLKLPHVNYHLAVFLKQTVFTLLLTRWGIDYFQNRWRDTDSSLQIFVQTRLVSLFRVLRVLVIIYLLFVGPFGSESVSTWIFRLLIETFLFIWAIAFWRAFDNRTTNDACRGETVPSGTLCLTARSLSYLAFGVALLIDLIGYHALTEHWLVSWAETLALLIWAQIGWMAIQEWNLSQKRVSESQEDGGAPMVVAPVGWLLVQVSRLIWLASILAGLLLAWAGTDYMVEASEKVVNMDFSVGSLRVSLKGMLLAVFIFYVTRVATRIGRRLLSEKILNSRDFERGLKDSIVTISSYIIWGLGLLLALGVLGVNATSMAVVFGALSIGIGFGLQNIFNNFISGLILLFERPIQVGDYVEVNGLWAEVKKINVRSTIVQTFDNATVIIPNSDFISQQVTNWSFKDPRMRRHVDIGVAYGSDLELVRKALLEIPDHIPHILKYPRPDVLFMDHGDSALIFRLRYWTHVDNFYSTSTDVRFALDRKFRELDIEIAFPQRDIHIRSDHTQTVSKAPDTESANLLNSKAESNQ